VKKIQLKRKLYFICELFCGV